MTDPTPVERPVKIALLTVSDSRTVQTDRSGDLLESRLLEAGHILVCRALLPDDRIALTNQIKSWANDSRIEVILTTGGTGLTGRDVTPEVVTAIADKLIPGFGELFRMISFRIIGTATIQSRACAAVIGQTLVFALPGSPSACRDAWDHILREQLDSRHSPCNFVEILPRLGEA